MQDHWGVNWEVKTTFFGGHGSMSLHTNVAIYQVHFVPSIELLHGPRWLHYYSFTWSKRFSQVDLNRTVHTPLQPFLSLSLFFFSFWSLKNIVGGLEIDQNWQGFVEWFMVNLKFFFGMCMPLDFE